MKKQIQHAWYMRNAELKMTRFAAGLFLLFTVLPFVIALAILDNRTSAMEKMMDAAVQGAVMQAEN